MKLSYIVNGDTYTTVKEVLKEYFNISDRLLRKLKRNEKIFLNGKNVLYINTTIQKNDIVEVFFDFEEDNCNVMPTKMNLNIIYEDEWYIVIDKCAGIPVHPSMLHYSDSLSNGVRYYFNSIGLKKKIRIVNRLDKDTSGIVIFAKNEYIQESLIEQMKSLKFEKEYIAICEGFFDTKHGTVDAPIARKEGSIMEREIDQKGDSAITHYDVIEENTIDNYSIVKYKLETGRTHQIRLHMKYIGHPIIGDTLYGNTSEKINRQALHAYRVSFIHPITKKRVEYFSNIPKDMLRIK